MDQEQYFFGSVGKIVCLQYGCRFHLIQKRYRRQHYGYNEDLKQRPSGSSCHMLHLHVTNLIVASLFSLLSRQLSHTFVPVKVVIVNAVLVIWLVFISMWMDGGSCS